ncbi:MAG: hypothetical protein WB987_10420 [Candidatus Acidiferrales bacterium]
MTSPSQNQEKEVRAQLYDVVRKNAYLHASYLDIAPIGNKQTVPLLLGRLRHDFGAFESGAPSGIGMAFDCAHAHLIEALRDITYISETVICVTA